MTFGVVCLLALSGCQKAAAPEVVAGEPEVSPEKAPLQPQVMLMSDSPPPSVPPDVAPATVPSEVATAPSEVAPVPSADQMAQQQMDRAAQRSSKIAGKAKGLENLVRQHRFHKLDSYAKRMGWTQDKAPATNNPEEVAWWQEWRGLRVEKVIRMAPPLEAAAPAMGPPQ